MCSFTPADADRSAAETNGLALGNLRQKLEACGPHCLLPAVEGALRRYGRLGSPRQKAMPRNLAARLVEGLGKRYAGTVSRKHVNVLLQLPGGERQVWLDRDAVEQI